MPLIIDTDIGTDIDDALALAYAIKSGIEIKLITTVHGPVETRAHLAKTLTLDLGQDIPVAIGEREPIKQRHIFETGIEDHDYIKQHALLPDAIDALAQTILENKGIEIASIGPLTNIAKAFNKYPELTQHVNHIYMMGHAHLADNTYFPNFRAHNFKVDPEAVDIVLSTSMPKTIITTPVCKKNYLTKDELNSLHGNPSFEYIRTTAFEWLDYIRYDVACLYDPLVIHHHLDQTITEKRTYGNTAITIDVGNFKEVLKHKLE